MTLYLEGAEPARAVAGKAMAGVNTGTVDAVMLDVFLTPIGQPVWTVVESAGRDMQNQFDNHKH